MAYGKEVPSVNWEGFDDSTDDFEIRNFAYMYDLYGGLPKEGLLELVRQWLTHSSTLWH